MDSMQLTGRIESSNETLKFRTEKEEFECEVGYNVSIRCLDDCTVQRYRFLSQSTSGRTLFFIEQCKAACAEAYDTTVSQILSSESVLDVRAGAFVLRKRSLFASSHDTSFSVCAYVFSVSQRIAVADTPSVASGCASSKQQTSGSCWLLKLFDDADTPHCSVTVICRNPQVGAQLALVTPSRRYVLTNLKCSTMNKGKPNEVSVFVLTQSSRILEVQEAALTDWRTRLLSAAEFARRANATIGSESESVRLLGEFEEALRRAKCAFGSKINPPFISVLRSFSARVTDTSILHKGILRVELLRTSHNQSTCGSNQLTESWEAHGPVAIEVHLDTTLSQWRPLPFTARGDVLHLFNFCRWRLNNGLFLALATVYSTIKLVSKSADSPCLRNDLQLERSAPPCQETVEISSLRFLLRNVFEKYEVTLLEYAAFVEQCYALCDAYALPLGVATRSVLSFVTETSHLRWTKRDERMSANRIQQFVDGLDTRVHSSYRSSLRSSDKQPQPISYFFQVLTVSRLLLLFDRLANRMNDLIALGKAGKSKMSVGDVLLSDSDFLSVDSIASSSVNASGNRAEVLVSRLLVTLKNVAVCGYLTACRLTGRLCLSASASYAAHRCDSHVHCVLAPFCAETAAMNGHALFGQLVLVNFGLGGTGARSRLIVERFTPSSTTVFYIQFAPSDCSLVNKESDARACTKQKCDNDSPLFIDVQVLHKMASNCDVRPFLTPRELTRCFKVKVRVMQESFSLLAPNAASCVQHVKTGAEVSLLCKADCLSWFAMLHERHSYRLLFTAASDLTHQFTYDKVDRLPLFVLSCCDRVRLLTLDCPSPASRPRCVMFSELLKLTHSSPSAGYAEMRYSFIARIASCSLERHSIAPPIANFMAEARPLCTSGSEPSIVLPNVQCMLYGEYQLQLQLIDPAAGERQDALEHSFNSDSECDCGLVGKSGDEASSRARQDEPDALTLFWIADKHVAQLGLLRNSVVEFRDVVLRRFGAKQHLVYEKASSLQLLELSPGDRHVAFCSRPVCKTPRNSHLEAPTQLLADVSAQSNSDHAQPVAATPSKRNSTLNKPLKSSEPQWPANDSDESWMALLCDDDEARLHQSARVYARRRSSRFVLPDEPAIHDVNANAVVKAQQPSTDECVAAEQFPRSTIATLRLRVIQRSIAANERFLVMAHVNVVISLRLKARCDVCAHSKLKSDVAISENFARAPVAPLDCDRCESPLSCETSCVLMTDDGTGCAWITLYDDAVRSFLALSTKQWNSLLRVVAHADTFQYRHREHRLVADAPPTTSCYAPLPSSATLYSQIRTYCANFQRQYKHKWFKFACHVAEQPEDELRKTAIQCAKDQAALTQGECYPQLFKLPSFCADHLL